MCRDLRTSGSRTPIILLTAKGQEQDKVLRPAGSVLVAPVTKPLSPEGARRPNSGRAAPGCPPAAARAFQFGNVHVDFSRHEVRRDGQLVETTPSELKLLRILLENRGSVLRSTNYCARAGETMSS